MTDPRERFDELIGDWIDGTLGAEERAEWEALLASNPDLAAEAREEANLAAQLRESASATSLPEAFPREFLDRLENIEIQREDSNRWAGMQRLALLAAGLVLFGTVYYFQGEGILDSETTPAPPQEVARLADVPPTAEESVGEAPMFFARSIDEVPAAAPGRIASDLRTRESLAMAGAEIAGRTAERRLEEATTHQPSLRRALAGFENQLLALSSDRDFAEAAVPEDGRLLELADGRLFAVIGPSSMGRQLAAFADILPPDADKMAELLAAPGGDPVERAVESMGATLLFSETDRLEMLEEAALPAVGGAATVDVWEFTVPGEAISALEWLRVDGGAVAQESFDDAEIIRRGYHLVLLIPRSRE